MTGGSATQGGRRYDNAGRAEQARLARGRVIDAARTLLIERGYPATTIKAVATAADVSAEMIYKSFGTKTALVKAVYDVTLAGDDEPVAMRARASIAAIIAAPSIEETVDLYADYVLELAERIGPLLSALRGGDPEFIATIEQERLTGVSQMAEHMDGTGLLRGDVRRARDVVWALLSPDMYHRLVVVRGWDHREYGAWLRSALKHELIR